VEGTCELGNKPSGSMKCGEFLGWLKTGELLKNDSAPWIKPMHSNSYCNASLSTTNPKGTAWD